MESHYFDAHNDSNTDALYAAASAEVSKSHPGPWVLQTIMTSDQCNAPQVPYLSLTCYPPISAMANLVDPQASGWLKQPSWQSSVNIVIVDFTKRIDYVDTAINANLARPPCGNTPPMGGYLNQCGGCSLSGCKLTCTECIPRSIFPPEIDDVSKCSGNIIYCDGRLICGICF
jgi:hypothetical protein